MTRSLATVAFLLLALAGRSHAITFVEPLGAPRVAGPGFQAPIVKDDGYGTSIAASGDTLVVGAPATGALPARAGAVYVYVRSGNDWYQQAKLLPPGGGAGGDRFGAGVAIDGNTLVVGAPGSDVVIGGNNRGAAHVYVRNAGTWSFQATLTASDGANNDEFGSAVAVSGNTALAGAPRDTSAAFEQGAAYAFVRSNTTWSEQQKLQRSGNSHGAERFGGALALEGDTAVFGVPLADNNGVSDRGAVIVMNRNAGTWSETVALYADDAETGDHLGQSVAISQTRIAAGAPDTDRQAGFSEDDGAVYIFTLGAQGWKQTQTLTEATVNEATTGDRLGTAVAIAGTRVATAAVFDLDGSVGSVFVFDFTPNLNSWNLVAKRQVRDGRASDYFLGRSVAIGAGGMVYASTGDVPVAVDQAGLVAAYDPARQFAQAALFFQGGQGGPQGFAVAISGDTAVVGAHQEDVGSAGEHGAVYVYVRENGTWRLQQRLVGANGADEGENNDEFGYAVAIDGDTLVVGAPGSDFFNNASFPGDSDEGAAYVFVRSGDGWVQQKKLSRSVDGDPGDRFGRAVAVRGDVIAVGVPFRTVGNNAGQGAVHVFKRSAGNWSESQVVTAPGGKAGDRFGLSVALSSDVLLAGAPYAALAGHDEQGFVAFYQATGVGTYAAGQAVNELALGSDSDYFGYAVAVQGNKALIGVFNDDEPGAANQGSAWLMTRPAPGSAWTRLSRMVAPDGIPSGRFGVSVALDGNTAHVGSYTYGGGTGATYRIDVSGTPAGFENLQASDAAFGDQFGFSLAADAGTVVIGAPYHGGIAGFAGDIGAVYASAAAATELFGDGFE